MDNKPSCLSLVSTWLMAILIVAVVSKNGVVGLLLGFILVIIGQPIREEHDRKCLERILLSKAWKSFFVSYYLLILGPIVAYSVTKHIYLSRLPIAVFVIMIGFPVIVTALVNDITTCRNNWKLKSRKDF